MSNDGEQNIQDNPEDILNPESTEQKPEEIQEKKVIDDSPKEEKKAIFKRKKIVIISSIITLIIVALIGGFYYWNMKKEANYKLSLAATQALIFDGAIADVDICGTYSTVWENAIDSEYEDFNTELANQKSANENNGTFTKSNNLKDDIDEGMRKLNNPPQKYQKVYDKIFEMYGIYSKIHSQALSPSGSLVTFNQNINTLQEDFIKAGNELKILIPSDSK